MSIHEVYLILGDDISTDVIYPGRFMATVLPTETPKYAFADYTEFNTKLNQGVIPKESIIIAGNNFGCGSSREQAASCLKGHDLIIIAKNFARIFLQNAINLGLKTIVCPDIEANLNDKLEITTDKIINKTTAKTFKILPFPPTRQAIIDAGGLINYTRNKLIQKYS